MREKERSVIDFSDTNFLLPQAMGAEVIPFTALSPLSSFGREGVELFMKIMSADGGETLRGSLVGERVEDNLKVGGNNFASLSLSLSPPRSLPLSFFIFSLPLSPSPPRPQISPSPSLDSINRNLSLCSHIGPSCRRL